LVGLQTIGAVFAVGFLAEVGCFYSPGFSAASFGFDAEPDEGFGSSFGASFFSDSTII
jgi:hypothetical protein